MSATGQGSGIFISYRHEDVPGHTGRLYDRLLERFGESRVFMDVDSVDLGLDFVTVLGRAVDSCEVMLVVMGPRWISAQADSGARRLDDPHDYVRMEVQAALASSTRAVPVLMAGASLPSERELPQPIQPLLRRQAYELHDATFQPDAKLLIDRLERILPGARGSARPLSGPQGGGPAWRATCQATWLSRRLDVSLSQSSHVIEYENRAIRGNVVRLDGTVVGRTRIAAEGKTERYEFTVPDGPDVRHAVVTVRLGVLRITHMALTVDGRELYTER